MAKKGNLLSVFVLQHGPRVFVVALSTGLFSPNGPRVTHGLHGVERGELAWLLACSLSRHAQQVSVEKN